MEKNSRVPHWKEPSDSPEQPHIVQLAASLVDMDTRAIISSMDVIVQPDGWEIPHDIIEIHGITNEYASEVGIPEPQAVAMLLSLWSDADRVRIGHNQPFDARILRIALRRYLDDTIADAWKQGRALCTMRMARPIMDLPRGKWPNLVEAYRFFTGETLTDAHTAAADVQATMRVYFAIQDLEEKAGERP